MPKPKKRRTNSQPKAMKKQTMKPRQACQHAGFEEASFILREEPPGNSEEAEVRRVEKPFCGNIRAGKNTYVYDAHTYHTKVPPEGIAKLVEYYTKPGQTVLDPFCGSGMTGVAAGNLRRKALLSDLSPAATFIARHLNTPVCADAYLQTVRKVLEDAADLEAELYHTPCRNCGTLTPLLYTVWSYGVMCPKCDREFVLWDVARDEKPSVRESKILSEFPCPHCASPLKKRRMKRTHRYPVQVGYKCCGRGLKEQTAELCEHDLAVLERIEAEGIPNFGAGHRHRRTRKSPASCSSRSPHSTSA